MSAGKLILINWVAKFKKFNLNYKVKFFQPLPTLGFVITMLTLLQYAYYIHLIQKTTAPKQSVKIQVYGRNTHKNDHNVHDIFKKLNSIQLNLN